MAKLLAAPLIVVFYLADKQTALLIYIPITLLNAFYLGPSFALIQSRAPLEIRSLAAAIMFFIINIIGLGLGPQLIGILSDALRPEYGQDSLRYALAMHFICWPVGSAALLYRRSPCAQW